jgi:hypothetical protein
MKKRGYLQYLKTIAGNDIMYENKSVNTDEAVKQEIYFFQRLLSGFGKHYLSEEGYYLKTKPEVHETIKQLKVALTLQGLEISENIIESIVETYNLILQKGGEVSMKDCFEVRKKVNKKYNQNWTFNYEINK